MRDLLRADDRTECVRRAKLTLAALCTLLALSACGEADPETPLAAGGTEEDRFPICQLTQHLIWSSLPLEAIPALTLPTMIGNEAPEAGYLSDEDRVLGVVVNGVARAYPHRILWYHEIVNDRSEDPSGSAMEPGSGSSA